MSVARIVLRRIADPGFVRESTVEVLDRLNSSDATLVPSTRSNGHAVHVSRDAVVLVEGADDLPGEATLATTTTFVATDAREDEVTFTAREVTYRTT